MGGRERNARRAAVVVGAWRVPHGVVPHSMFNVRVIVFVGRLVVKAQAGIRKRTRARASPADGSEVAERCGHLPALRLKIKCLV